MINVTAILMEILHFWSSSCRSDRSYVCFCLDYHIGSTHSQLVAELVLGKIQPSVVFSGVPETGQSLASSLINFSISVLYLVSSLVLSNLRAFAHIAPYNSSFQEGNIPLVFNLNYFFLVNSTSSCVSRMILLAVAHRISFKQFSSAWSGPFSPHLAHVCRPL